MVSPTETLIPTLETPETEILGSILAAQPPVFLSQIDAYDLIFSDAQSARADLDRIEAADGADNFRRQRYLAELAIREGRIDESNKVDYEDYVRRESLREKASLVNDADTVIRKYGGAMVQAIKRSSLPEGPLKLAGGIYILEAVTEYSRLPLGEQFYRQDQTDEVPVIFGEFHYSPRDKKQFRRADVKDIIRLTQDIRHQPER